MEAAIVYLGHLGNMCPTSKAKSTSLLRVWGLGLRVVCLGVRQKG